MSRDLPQGVPGPTGDARDPQARQDANQAITAADRLSASLEKFEGRLETNEAATTEGTKWRRRFTWAVGIGSVIVAGAIVAIVIGLFALRHGNQSNHRLTLRLSQVSEQTLEQQCATTYKGRTDLNNKFEGLANLARLLQPGPGRDLLVATLTNDLPVPDCAAEARARLKKNGS